MLAKTEQYGGRQSNGATVDDTRGREASAEAGAGGMCDEWDDDGGVAEFSN